MLKRKLESRLSYVDLSPVSRGIGFYRYIDFKFDHLDKRIWEMEKEKVLENLSRDIEGCIAQVKSSVLQEVTQRVSNEI